jgi:glutamine synthetase
MAGIDGILNKIDPSKEGFGPYDYNLYNLSKEDQAKIKSLPRSLEESIEALREDHDFLLQGGVFSKRLIDLWIENKTAEAAKFSQIPHPAEYDMYYSL